LRAAALTLSYYAHLEDIPKDWRHSHPSILKARLLSESPFNGWNDALLFRILQPFDWMCPFLIASRIFVGRDRARTLKNTADD
jgi:hypothetical protein